MTTHSPYIVNYMSIAIQGSNLFKQIEKSDKKKLLSPKLEDVVSSESLISAENVVIYQLDEKNGSISKLTSYEGIPSDGNYLNDMLSEGNRMFDTLLEIEEEL